MRKQKIYNVEIGDVPHLVIADGPARARRAVLEHVGIRVSVPSPREIMDIAASGSSQCILPKEIAEGSGNE